MSHNNLLRHIRCLAVAVAPCRRLYESSTTHFLAMSSDNTQNSFQCHFDQCSESRFQFCDANEQICQSCTPYLQKYADGDFTVPISKCLQYFYTDVHQRLTNQTQQLERYEAQDGKFFQWSDAEKLYLGVIALLLLVILLLICYFQNQRHKKRKRPARNDRDNEGQKMNLLDREKRESKEKTSDYSLSTHETDSLIHGEEAVAKDDDHVECATDPDTDVVIEVDSPQRSVCENPSKGQNPNCQHQSSRKPDTQNAIQNGCALPELLSQEPERHFSDDTVHLRSGHPATTQDQRLHCCEGQTSANCSGATTAGVSGDNESGCGLAEKVYSKISQVPDSQPDNSSPCFT